MAGGEQALRPAIARSAALGDKDCDRQWELPMSVMSSQGWSEDDRVAWVRAPRCGRTPDRGVGDAPTRR